MNPENRLQFTDQPPRDTWWGLADELLDVFHIAPHIGFPKGPPTCEWRVGATPDFPEPSPNGFTADFVRAEKPFRDEVESAIRAAISGDRMSLCDEARYFLDIRCCVIMQFCSWAEIDRGDEGNCTETILPFPKLPLVRVVEWLMIYWWNQNGPEIAALLRLKAMHTGE